LNDWDLVIVGGGPVGLVTAIAARRAGLSALVLEQSPGLPEKACGEGLMPGAVTTLSALGVDLADAVELQGIRFLDGAEVASARFPDGCGRALSRQRLMRRLDARARALGVTVSPGHTLRDFQHHAGTVEVQATAAGGGRLTCRARLLVAADGLRSPIRRRLGYELPPRHPARFGVQRHFQCEPWSDWVEVYWHDQAEAYVTPLGPAEVGVAVLGHGRPVSHAELAQLFPGLGRRLSLANALGRVRGAGPLEQRVARLLAPGVALVGDAAGYLDAISGEGLALGFASAVVLVERFASGQLWRYPRDHAQLARAYYGVTYAMLALSRRPRLRRATIGYLSRRPRLFSDLLGIAADSAVVPASRLGRALRWCVTRQRLLLD
jgi:flavin-dependent dehydrogenase